METSRWIQLYIDSHAVNSVYVCKIHIDLYDNMVFSFIFTEFLWSVYPSPSRICFSCFNYKPSLGSVVAYNHRFPEVFRTWTTYLQAAVLSPLAHLWMLLNIDNES